MVAKRLRAATDDDIPVILSVSEASERDNQLEELRAMRRVIARHIDDDKTLARDLAALTRRQMEISREITALQAQQLEQAKEESEMGGATDAKWNAQAI